LRAVADATKSRRLQWFVAFVVLPSVGWLGAKIDTRVEVATLRRDIARVRNDLITARSDVLALRTRLDAQVLGPPYIELKLAGDVWLLKEWAKDAHRGVVRATSLALAYESERRKQEKKRFAGELIRRYDTYLKAGKAPPDAAELVLAGIALP